MNKKKYYPNNWKVYKDAPEGLFEDIPWDVFMDWRVDGWELPPAVFCVIREQNRVSKKTKEHVYRRPHAAKAKIKKLLCKDDVTTVVCTSDAVVTISLNPLFK